MTDNRMLDRIKALLAKAASTDHEAEAMAFIAKAHELMEKYQIDVDDLDNNDPVGHEHAAHKKGEVANDWDFRLMFSVAKYFGCKAIQCDNWGFHPKTHRYQNLGFHMDLFGRESARVTAIEMHKYLVTTVRRLGREMHKQEPYRSADWWARKIGNALRLRIDELAPAPESASTKAAQQNALMTVDQVQALVKQVYPKLHTIKGTLWTTKSAKEVADSINLNVQVGGSETLRLR